MVIELSCDGATAELLPEYGGRLHQLSVPVGGRAEPLLTSPDDVRRYRTEPIQGGSFPMAPWPNRIREGRFTWRGREYALETSGGPNTIHGLVADAEWSVVARTARVCEMAVRLDERWPWAARAWQRFELAPGQLRMKMEVRSDREEFPAGCGWHPWFRRHVRGTDEVRVQAPATRRYLIDEHLPTGTVVEPAGAFDLRELTALGERRLDDCYAGLRGPVVIDWGAVRLEITTACSEPHLMVYSPAEAVCIEPQTCAPDAFNLAAAGVAGTGFAVAAPGRAVSISCTWRWETRS